MLLTIILITILIRMIVSNMIPAPTRYRAIVLARSRGLASPGCGAVGEGSDLRGFRLTISLPES